MAQKSCIFFGLFCFIFAQLSAQVVPLSVTNRADLILTVETANGKALFICNNTLRSDITSPNYNAAVDSVPWYLANIDAEGNVTTKPYYNHADTTALNMGLYKSYDKSTGKILLVTYLSDSVVRAGIATKYKYCNIIIGDTNLSKFDEYPIQAVDSNYNLGSNGNPLMLNDSTVILQNLLLNGKGALHKMDLYHGYSLQSVELPNIFNVPSMHIAKLNDSVIVSFSDVVNYVATDSLYIRGKDTVRWQDYAIGGPITGLEFTPEDTSYRTLRRDAEVHCVRINSSCIAASEFVFPFHLLQDFGPVASSRTMINSTGWVSFGTSVVAVATSMPNTDSFAVAFGSNNPNTSWIKKLPMPFGKAVNANVAKVSADKFVVVVHTVDDAAIGYYDAYYIILDTLGTIISSVSSQLQLTPKKPILYPNPATMQAVIGNTLPQNIKAYSLYTSDGTLIRNVLHSAVIDTRQLPCGLYYVDIETVHGHFSCAMSVAR
jgi:hypothetical protein